MDFTLNWLHVTGLSLRGSLLNRLPGFVKKGSEKFLFLPGSYMSVHFTSEKIPENCQKNFLEKVLNERADVTPTP